MTFHIEASDGRVRGADVRTPLLTPTEAEVHVSFTLTEPVAGPEVRGRLTGPRCPYSSTIEIAYPVRPLPLRGTEGTTEVTGRVIIPEPSLWDPVSPFLYEGVIELRADHQLLARLRVSLGLRAPKLTPKGLHWNGRPWQVVGTAAPATTEAELRQLRQAGSNTLLLPADDQAAAVCELADRFGLFVLLELDRLPAPVALARHACCLGWVVPQHPFTDANTRAELLALTGPGQPLLGVAVEQDTDADLTGAAFALGERVRVERLPLPKLIRPRAGEERPAGEGVLGVVEG